ncbi:hypothetical protein EBZ38_06690 [bacterium]|nr:hypothetical protein [bacterium]
MHDKLKKLIDKKKARGEEMSPNEKKAKGSVLEDLIGSMGDEMKGNLKKVTVASSSKKGLEKGLEKAQEMMGKLPSDKEMEEMTEDAEGGHEEESEYGKEAEESPEALKAKIKELEAKLKEMKGEEEAEEEEESEESEE